MKQSLLKLAFAAVMLMLVAPFAGSRAVAQTHNLTGTVVDAQGNPVAGAAVVIDGTTEFGATCPTAALTANIMIVIDGTPIGSDVSRGLDVWRNAAAPSGSTIKGVAIGGFGYGVTLDGDGHAVKCSLIGLNADGSSLLSNQTAGIYVWQGSGITIGGSAYADRNVISGNTRDGGISLTEREYSRDRIPADLIRELRELEKKIADRRITVGSYLKG